ncbi:MAG: hypothetical protein HY726_14345 [Candidatus Rokubacteria bacterium]|nr:hypothetical protein [Candidatus Rokubacteria bacterium]
MGWALMMAGVIVGAVSGLADLLGIGGARGFGWKQTVGVVVGLALIGLGWYLGRKPPAAS